MEEEVLFKIEIPGATGLVTSIENLTKANKALREERKKLDLDSASGKARAKEINDSLDSNTKKITENTSAIEKQRANIGNYTNSIKDAIPFYRKAEQAQGALTGGMNLFGKALIATGIGAFVVALGSLIAYLKGSEEGQNKLNKIVQIGSAIMERLMDVVEDVGEVIFNAIENPKEALINFGKLIKDNIINRFEGILEFIPAIGKSINLLFKGDFEAAGKVAFDAVAKVTTGIENASDKVIGFIKGVSDAVKAGINEGEKIAAMMAGIDSKERDLIVKRAETNKKVAELRDRAIQEEGEVKRKTIEEAISLEQSLVDEEVKFAKQKRDLSIQQQKTEGDTKEAKLAVAEATAAVFDAEAKGFESTLKLNKERQKLIDDQFQQEQEVRRKAIEIELEDETARREAMLELKKEFDEEQIIIEADTVEQTEVIYDEATQRRMDNALKLNKLREELIKKGLTQEQATQAVHKIVEQNKLAVTSEALDQAAGLFKKHTIAYKVIATGKAIIDTYSAATAALGFVNPIVGGIFAALAILTGLSNIAKINGVQFADGGLVPGYAVGGLSGTRIESRHGRPITRSNGDNRLATVRVGEVILNEEQQAALGGSRTFRSIGVPGFAGGGSTDIPSLATAQISRQSEAASFSRELLNSIAQIQPVVTVEDINAGQSRVFVTESRSKVL